jgi:hypothetical protein
VKLGEANFLLQGKLILTMTNHQYV